MDRVNCNVHFELVDLSLLNIDQSIIFQGTEDRGHTFTYVWKLLEIMQPKLIELFQLTSIESHNGDTRVLCLKGRSYPLLHQSVQRIAQALSGPVYVNKVPLDLVVALRVLLHQKRQFSLNTGCWMHFNWKEREVACYGLEPILAENFIQKIYSEVNSCRNNPVNGWVIVDHAFPIKLKRFIKKYVDFVESRSGARVAVKKEGKGNGNVVVQFYGPYNSIQQACDVITKELGPMCDGIMKQRNKKKIVTSPQTTQNANAPLRTPFASTLDKVSEVSNPSTPTTPITPLKVVPRTTSRSQLEEFFPPPPPPIGAKDYPYNDKRLSDPGAGIASFSLFTNSDLSDSSRSTSTDFHPISGCSSMISITPSTISGSSSMHSDDGGIPIVFEDMGNENKWIWDLLEEKMSNKHGGGTRS